MKGWRYTIRNKDCKVSKFSGLSKCKFMGLDPGEGG